MAAIPSFLNDIQGLKGSFPQWYGRCPAHDDQHSSLSVSIRDEGTVLLKCHAGCSIEAITSALGITKKDLFPPKGPGGGSGRPAPREGKVIRKIYRYPNGAEKIRYTDKNFAWRHTDSSGRVIWNRQGLAPTLYVAGKLEGTVYLAEGEKDADSLRALGYNAASGENGAGPGKWLEAYTKQLEGLPVIILQDNDAQGKAYAMETANALIGRASAVQLLDLAQVWEDMPVHADISDCIEKYGPEVTRAMLEDLREKTPQWQPRRVPDPFFDRLCSLMEFNEEEASWLIPGWIPEGQVSLLAAEGGVGKTTIWCSLAAALSSGQRTFLDPPGLEREPQRVLFLTTEDSIRKKLRKKLRLAGADLQNIIAPDFAADTEGQLKGLKFGSAELEKAIAHFRPALCIFDPVQGFVPPAVSMASRNEMRDCLAPLVSWGERYNTAFLLICHSNKRKGAYGRDRIADSADLWDIARSVLMCGYTEEEGQRYLSNEKNNYAMLQKTTLFSISDSEQIELEGTTWKRDRDFTQEAILSNTARKKKSCREWILDALKDAGGQMESDELKEKAEKEGYSYRTFRRAREELKKNGDIVFLAAGSNRGKGQKWYTQLSDQPRQGEMWEDWEEWEDQL